MATVVDRPQAAAAAPRPRPRFARQIEAPKLNLPAGRKMGSILAAIHDVGGDLWILNQPTVQYQDMPGEWMPAVVRFDAAHNMVDAWGGPDSVPAIDGISQWPEGLEGMELDGDGNVWIFGYKADDDAALKFDAKGKLLLQIGQRGKPGNDDSTDRLGRATSCYVDTKAREVFISDGYGNHRVVAFNCDTGAFTRMWGAYGKKPSSLSPEEGFANPVHKVACGPDGHILVADRIKNRVQQFALVPGGADFLREVVVGPTTMLFGAAFDIAFSPDGIFMYVADGSNRRVWIIDYANFDVLGWVSACDEVEGDYNQPAHFGLLHRFSVDEDGNLWLACVSRGLRMLRFEGVR